MVTVDQMNQLSDLELDIYNYIISHRHEVIHMKLKDLSTDLHVSSSMITRVAKKLGYEGFLEWKAEMKLDQEDKPIQNKRALNYILDYFNRVDNKEFDALIHQAAEIIVNSHEVICFGIGLSDAIASLRLLYLIVKENVQCIVETSVPVLGGCMIKMTVLFSSRFQEKQEKSLIVSKN